MGLENTSKFKVTSSKSRKRTKRNYKSEEIKDKIDNNVNISECDTNQVENVNKQDMKRKRQNEKRKSNNINDNIDKNIIKDDKEENVYTEIKENQDVEDTNDEESSPNKKANIHTTNGLNDTEEIYKTNLETPKQPSKRQLKREKAENVYTEIKENQDVEDTNDEESSPNKKANIHTTNGLNDTEEIYKTNLETPKQPSKRQLKREKAENVYTGIKENQDIEDTKNDEESSPNKKANIHTTNGLNDTEEIYKNNSKTSKQPSKRQLKKLKAEKRKNERRMANRIEAMTKGLNYVSKWKYARSEWKFEKIRQIWLIDNLLDETYIPDDIFPIVLEYFEGCKGMARELLLRKGLDVVRKVENEENKDEIESIAYQRARKLLQALPTET